MKDKRLYKRSKYKIGDIIVYKDRYADPKKNSVIDVFQEKIIRACGILEYYDKKDTLSWVYYTQRQEEEKEDCIYDNEILYKIV
jgi:hypothetical protein